MLLLQFSPLDMELVARDTIKSESESLSPQLPSPGVNQVAFPDRLTVVVEESALFPAWEVVTIATVSLSVASGLVEL